MATGNVPRWFRRTFGRRLAPRSRNVGPPYVYTSLNEETKETWLMTLLPGARPLEIRVLLESICADGRLYASV